MVRLALPQGIHEREGRAGDEQIEAFKLDVVERHEVAPLYRAQNLEGLVLPLLVQPLRLSSPAELSKEAWIRFRVAWRARVGLRRRLGVGGSLDGSLEGGLEDLLLARRYCLLLCDLAEVLERRQTPADALNKGRSSEAVQERGRGEMTHGCGGQWTVSQLVLWLLPLECCNPSLVVDHFAPVCDQSKERRLAVSLSPHSHSAQNGRQKCR